MASASKKADMHRKTLEVAAFLTSFEKTACSGLAQPYRVGPFARLAYQPADFILAPLQ